MTLKELRKEKRLTQAQCAAFLGVPLRTYQYYERPDADMQSLKYRYMLEKLQQYGFVDEEHGLLSVETIRSVCSPVFEKYGVTQCYLFGSYAKGRATERSDVDLLVFTETTGLRFFELVEVLRESLRKKVDVLDQSQLKGNDVLVSEILKDGIKIYG